MKLCKDLISEHKNLQNDLALMGDLFASYMVVRRDPWTQSLWSRYKWRCRGDSKTKFVATNCKKRKTTYKTSRQNSLCKLAFIDAI